MVTVVLVGGAWVGGVFLFTTNHIEPDTIERSPISISPLGINPQFGKGVDYTQEVSIRK